MCSPFSKFQDLDSFACPDDIDTYRPKKKKTKTVYSLRHNAIEGSRDEFHVFIQTLRHVTYTSCEICITGILKIHKYLYT